MMESLWLELYKRVEDVEKEIVELEKKVERLKADSKAQDEINKQFLKAMVYMAVRVREEIVNEANDYKELKEKLLKIEEREEWKRELQDSIITEREPPKYEELFKRKREGFSEKWDEFLKYVDDIKSGKIRRVEVARRLGVAPSTVISWLRRLEDEG